MNHTFSDSTLRALRKYSGPEAVVMLLLGFSAGLPFYMIYQNLSVWLASAGIDRGTIGLLALTGIAYSFKFLWAPAVDHIPVPVLERITGRRRAWMIVAQIAVFLSLTGMSLCNPPENLLFISLLACAAAFAGATQDIAIDAWRIEAAGTRHQGILAAAYQYGYRIAILTAGTGTLFIADTSGWPVSYRIMALLMAVGVLTALLAPGKIPEHRKKAARPERAGLRETAGKSVIDPFRDFFSRYGRRAAVILAFIALFRIPDFVLGYMAGVFYVEQGYDLTTIGAIRSGAGLFATLFGIFAGGFLVSGFSQRQCLVTGIILQSVTNLFYTWLAFQGPDTVSLAITVIVDNIAGGAAGTILIAYMSSLTNRAYTATQYALFSSFYALPGKFIGSLSGYAVNILGFPGFFTLTAAMGIPALVLLLFIKFPPPDPSVTEQGRDLNS